MKIDHILVQDFLGVQLVDVATPEPVQLFAGRNAAGKSTVRDAVALAITGELSRVKLKKEADQLVRTGAAQGAEGVVRDGNGDDYGFTISASGKLSTTKKQAPEFGLVLDAQRFASLPDDERRTYLFDLMGVKVTPAEIGKELEQDGHQKERVAVVLPLLRSGFPAAAKEAKERATACKGAWRATTGETWGSDKGGTWKAPVPVHDPATLAKLQTEIKHADAALATWNETKGKLKAEADARQRKQAELEPLREVAALEQRRRDKLTVDEAEKARLQPLLDRALADAGAMLRTGTLHELAAALHSLIKLIGAFELEATEQPTLDQARFVLANYEAQHGRVGGSPDPEAAGRADRLRQAMTTCQSAIAHAQRDLNASLDAKTKIALVEAELAQPLDPEALADAERNIAEITAARAATVKALDEQRDLKTLADAAEEKTTKAAAAHADVLAWDRLGDALSPDGLPAKLLSRALAPINERLDLSSADSGWLPVVIHGDMRITGAGRDYRLLSESERWRVDAMLAEAIANLSGMRLLVLDRFDVLEPSARGEALGWFDVLAESGEIDTALLFGTLKEPPANLPPSIGVHWIDAGKCIAAKRQLKKEAA